MDKGLLLVISGPSGSGKGTVVKQLTREDFALSVSLTTRNRREGEVDGRDYFFCSEDEFHQKAENGELLEFAMFCGNFYGTPRSYVEDRIALGKTVVLEIDVNGALQIREKFSEAVLVFLIPPTKDELRNRLNKRATEDMGKIEVRLKRAREEVNLIDKYDYLVINDDINKATEDIYAIVKAEKLKPFRNGEKVKQFKGEEKPC